MPYDLNAWRSHRTNARTNMTTFQDPDAVSVVGGLHRRIARLVTPTSADNQSRTAALVSTARDTPSKVAVPGGTPAIEIASLAVSTKDILVEITDWCIPAGSRVALIGPNGAGKTTIMEALLGLRRTERLSARMLGSQLSEWHRKPDLRRKLGVLLQQASLPPELHVRDIVSLHRQLYRRSSSAAVDALGIGPLLDKVYRSLSRGERQRVDLFVALAHEPEVAFLDEPFTALDHQHALATADLIQSLKETSIVMACHNPAELALASMAAWIVGGKVRRCDAPDTLRRGLMGDFRLQVAFQAADAAERFGRKLIDQVRPQFTNAVSPTQLSIFGSEALVQVARGLVDHADIIAVEFGRTTFADLLYRCSRGDIDA
jgi:ABC-2 type transport system ATP-binding protein